MVEATLIFRRAEIDRAEPVHIVLGVGLRDEAFIAGDHRHDDKARDQSGVDKRGHRKDRVRLVERERAEHEGVKLLREGSRVDGRRGAKPRSKTASSQREARSGIRWRGPRRFIGVLRLIRFCEMLLPSGAAHAGGGKTKAACETYSFEDRRATAPRAKVPLAPHLRRRSRVPLTVFALALHHGHWQAGCFAGMSPMRHDPRFHDDPLRHRTVGR